MSAVAELDERELRGRASDVVRVQKALGNGHELRCREEDFILGSKPGPRYQRVAAFSVT